MKKFLTMLILAMMSFGISGCVEVRDTNTQNTIQDIESSQIPESDMDVSTEDMGTESNLPEYAKPGQVVSGDKWSIALLYAKEYNSIDSEYYSDKPEEGNVYLALFFDVKNISNENAYFNSLYFEGYADDYSVNSALILGSPDGMSSVGGDVDAGKMTKGVIVYEVPSDWKTFEISYKDGIWTTHRAATFLVEKNEIAAQDYVFSGSVYDEYIMDDSKKTEIGTEVNSPNWNVKLIDIKKYSEVGDSLTFVAGEGKEFVLFYLEAQNTSLKDDYFNYLYFRFYVDGYITNQTIFLSDVDGYSSMSGDVAAGKKIKGYIAVEAPIGWKSVELIYDDGTFTENKVAEFGIINE